MENIASGSSASTVLLFVPVEEKLAFTSIRFILQSQWFLAKTALNSCIDLRWLNGIEMKILFVAKQKKIGM
ncbi:hypothetical protein [Pedobacter sp. Hv1]|uniref:hypothetical protein n=1 Tax=Pedobacter sp. Hv1 TaxID=1740090 RepID=UPI000AF908C0|nr:hypothetical protein [Pedobacter sp. Hv1]